MGRLSVSLDQGQEEWVEEKTEELGVSKGKVIRECITQVSKGDSLLTESKAPADTVAPDRIAALEDRLESLENTLEAVTVQESGSDSSHPASDHPAKQDSPASIEAAGGSSDETHSDPDMHDEGRKSTPAQSDPPSPKPPSSEAPTATEEGSDTEVADEEQAQTNSDPGGKSSTATEGATARAQPSIDGPAGGATDAESDEASRDAELDSATIQDQTDQSGTESAAESPIKITADRTDEEAIESELQTGLENTTRAEVVFGIWKQLQERGTLHVKSMKNLYEEFPLGYDTEEEWWQEGIQPVLVELPGVEEPQGGGNLYRFKY